MTTITQKESIVFYVEDNTIIRKRVARTLDNVLRKRGDPYSLYTFAARDEYIKALRGKVFAGWDKPITNTNQDRKEFLPVYPQMIITDNNFPAAEGMSEEPLGGKIAREMAEYLNDKKVDERPFVVMSSDDVPDLEELTKKGVLSAVLKKNFVGEDVLALFEKVFPNRTNNRPFTPLYPPVTPLYIEGKPFSTKAPQTPLPSAAFEADSFSSLQKQHA